MTSEQRITWGLVIDVLDALERHGYHRCNTQHTGQAILMIGDLASTYQGTHDHSRIPGIVPAELAPHAGPGPAVPEAEDAVILTDAEVSTVVTALDLAAEYKRDRADACADCAEQSCPACQTRLKDARTYDQMAADMLQTAQTARTANANQPEPGTSGPAGVQSDREAGQ
jgi:hypothetical protein